jgi:hypothetical protein
VKIVLFALACLAISHSARASHPLEEWQQLGPAPTSRELQDIASGEGKWVVVFGDPAGRALVSNDGVAFEPQPLGLPPGLMATRILHAAGKWLVLAGGRVWSKSNWSDAWTEGNPITYGFAELRALDGGFWGWSAGGYFASGNFPFSQVWRNSALYRSTDGLTWTAVTLSPDPTNRFAITELIHAAGIHVLTNSAYGGTSGIWTSADGSAWTGLAQVTGYFYSVTYGNGQFVAGGSDGRIAISTEAVNWTVAQFPFVTVYLTNGEPGSATPIYSEAREMVFSNGKFVALAEGYFNIPLLAESADGVTWTAENDEHFARTQATRLRQIGDQTYLLGRSGNLWQTSLWQAAHAQLLPLQGWDWRAVAANATRLVIAGEGGHLLWSDDAVNFHPVLLPDAAGVEDLIWVPELALFLAAGGDSTVAQVWSSPNGADWTSIPLASFASRATGLAWNGNQLLVSGPDGRLAASTDGVIWEARESGFTASLNAIEWGGGHFVATGNEGMVIHSADGVVWTAVNLGPETVTYRGLAYGNGLWVVPDGYKLHITEDLQNWWKSPGQAYEPNPLFAFGQFITTDHRTLLGSTDGGYWQPYVDGYAPGTAYSPLIGFTRGTRFGNRVVFVGQDGQIGVSGEWRNFFQEWQSTKFTLEERSIASFSGPDADPDNDGWSNAFEFAFNLNPKARETSANAVASTYQVEHETDPTVTLATFNHPWAALRPGVSIWPENSRDLVNWTREGILSNYPYSTGDGKLRKEIHLPIRSAEPEFIRLRGEIITP